MRARIAWSGSADAPVELRSDAVAFGPPLAVNAVPVPGWNGPRPWAAVSAAQPDPNTPPLHFILDHGTPGGLFLLRPGEPERALAPNRLERLHNRDVLRFGRGPSCEVTFEHDALSVINVAATPAPEVEKECERRAQSLIRDLLRSFEARIVRRVRRLAGAAAVALALVAGGLVLYVRAVRAEILAQLRQDVEAVTRDFSDREKAYDRDKAAVLRDRAEQLARISGLSDVVQQLQRTVEEPEADIVRRVRPNVLLVAADVEYRDASGARRHRTLFASGTLLDRQGTFVTSRHVVQPQLYPDLSGARDVRVELRAWENDTHCFRDDGLPTAYAVVPAPEAAPASADALALAEMNLVIARLPSPPRAYEEWKPARASLAQPAYVVAYPNGLSFGGGLRTSPTMTPPGRVTALGSVMQIVAPASPACAGAPVVGRDGALLGILAWTVPEPRGSVCHVVSPDRAGKPPPPQPFTARAHVIAAAALASGSESASRAFAVSALNAEEEIHKVLGRTAQDMTGDLRAELWARTERAVACERMGLHARAVAEFDHVVRLAPAFQDAHLERSARLNAALARLKSPDTRDAGFADAMRLTRDWTPPPEALAALSRAASGAEARSLAERAERAARDRNDRRGLALARLALAHALLGEKKRDEAKRLLEETLRDAPASARVDALVALADLGEETLQEATLALDELRLRYGALDEDKRAFVERHRDVYRRSITWWSGRDRRRAFAEVENFRGRALLDLIASRRIVTQAVPRDVLAAHDAALQKLVDLRARLDGGTAGLEQEWREAESRYADARRNLEPHWQRECVRARSPDEIIGALGNDEALIVYQILADGRLVAFVVTRDVHLVDLGTYADAEKAAKDLLAGLRQSKPIPAAVEQSAASHLVDKLAPLLTGVSLLRIVPDGYLHNLPFEALRFGDDYLGTRFAVSYVPSGSALTLKSARPAGSRVALFADPKLAGAEIDVAVVQKHFPGTVARPPARQSDAYVDARFVHFACHGEEHPYDPDQIALGDERIDAREIADLAMTPEVVVLAACRSSNSKVTGEGARGLVHAFRVAGARSVLGTHWSIDSTAYREFFETFYGELKKDADPARAAQAARQRCRAAHEHPHYWAAFVLHGR